jgi:hypothetical protein
MAIHEKLLNRKRLEDDGECEEFRTDNSNWAMLIPF